MHKKPGESIFDQWSDYVVKVLKAESELAGALLNHKVELGNAREALIKGVLSRILPSAYEIGTGEIIDSSVGTSNQIDIVISRRDAPSLALAGGSRVYLVESVLATIEVKSRLDEPGLTKALENCASVADLVFKVKPASYDRMVTDRMAESAGVKNVEGGFLFDDVLESKRFLLRGKPVSYIFGFRGYTTDMDQFAEVIGKWGGQRSNDPKLDFDMPHVPAVIATEGLFALRNAEPFDRSPDGPGKERVLCLIGKDSTPLRILIAHLLHTLNSKMPPGEYGLIPSPNAYLQDTRRIDFERGLFEVPVGKGFIPRRDADDSVTT